MYARDSCESSSLAVDESILRDADELGHELDPEARVWKLYKDEALDARAAVCGCACRTLAQGNAQGDCSFLFCTASY